MQFHISQSLIGTLASEDRQIELIDWTAEYCDIKFPEQPLDLVSNDLIEKSLNGLHPWR